MSIMLKNLFVLLIISGSLLLYSCSPSIMDRDKDTVVDKLDKCPDQPEDIDGFEDEDGCPDLDNDKDGIPDTLDKCPDQPEDIDGFEDEDGCPDLDNDKDGIPDAKDADPFNAEDIDGFKDDDGKPDLDNDGDKIPDDVDNCPDTSEDYDGFEDEDGCPDLDNDGDGISDDRDKCPDEAETINKFEDDDGCPDRKILKKDERVIMNNIYFKTDSDELLQESYIAFEGVERIFLDNPNIVILIEGHTDSDGDLMYNQILSEKRAKTVYQYLIDKLNISKKQLKYIGYGESQPISSNATAYGKAKNRRIEFRVLSNEE